MCCSLGCSNKDAGGKKKLIETSMTVTPPKAEDLKLYTSDLPGNGPLKAAIETSMGTFDCDLYGDKAPATVANFVGLARGLKAFFNPRTNKVDKKPFFDGIVFHRVIPNFMIQRVIPSVLAKAVLDIPLRMNFTKNSSMILVAYCPWPIEGLVPTDHSFLSRRNPRRI